MKNKIQEDLKNALKSKNAELVQSIREIISNITTVEKKEGKELNDDQIIQTLSSLSKRLGKTGDEYKTYADEAKAKNVNSTDLYNRANKEYYTKSIVDSYLPAQMSKEEIEAAIINILESLDKENPKQYNIGFITGAFVKANNGKQYDTPVVIKLIKEKI